ncbi:hypothetical protein SAMN04488122_2728 [Chitinophaga arvensicola]|uniref:Histidine kinase n=2 Tax=Chitinophaga arvensicola TaxID=29529 RepID=A0A1I0REK5_9BACT|nr:hypothetical protein SAMN04488122_2728 [Chitinophaga arvensicola]
MVLIGLYAFPGIRVNWPSAFGLKWVLVKDVLYGFINFQLFYLLAFGWLPVPVEKKQYAKAALGMVLLVLGFAVIKYAVGYFFFPDQVLMGMVPLIGQPKVYLSFAAYLPLALKTGMGVALLAYGYCLFLQWRNTDPADRQLASMVAQTHARYERMQHGSRQLLHHLQLLTPILENEQQRETEGTKAILLLSDLLRYMLYDKALENEYVGIKKEVVHFEKYVQLRGLLIATPQLHLRIAGEENSGMIPPLRLQQLTEEVLQSTTEPEVSITLSMEKDALMLSLQAGTAPCVSHKIKWHE